MPRNTNDAIRFLETQWSSTNENKIKGIKAEIEFRSFLENNDIHFIPGGWIMMPGKNTHVKIPSNHKICLLPVEADFSWASSGRAAGVTPALISAYNYFRQVGVQTYIVEPKQVNESNFSIPVKSNGKLPAEYPRDYELIFKSLSPRGGYIESEFSEVFSKFPRRRGNIGLRSYEQGRIDRAIPPWNNQDSVRDLFWFEYTRYYCQVDYLLSNNDLDLFLIGNSGLPYPVELKSKSPVVDKNLGDWFGLDIGPFAKMAFFTSNSMNTDALYIVQEVDEHRGLINWLAIKFTDLVKNCFWVGQAGGQGMSGNTSATVKVPKLAFTELSDLLRNL